MKRILSVCILAAMLLSMLTLSTFSAFALDEDLEATEETEAVEGETDAAEGETEETEEENSRLAAYRINWAAQSFYTYKYNETRTNDNYMKYFTVDKTARYINSTGTTSYDGSGGGRAYFSQQMFDITDSTHYEYCFKVKNNLNQEYAGIVFGFGEGLAYIMYGSFNNTALAPNTGESAITLYKGLHASASNDCSTGFESRFIKVDLDENGFGHYKIVYKGYDVSVYGLTDSENGVYEQIGSTIKLSTDAKVALGVYAMTELSGPNRTVNLSDCMLYAMNEATAEILAPYDDGSCEFLDFIKTAEKEHLEEDCVPESYGEFKEAIDEGKALIEGWEFTQTDIDDAKKKIELAMELLDFVEPDFTALSGAIAQFDALVKTEYTLDSYNAAAEAVNAGRELLNATEVKQSQVNAAVEAISSKITALVRTGYTNNNMESASSTETLSTDQSQAQSGCGGCGSSASVGAIVIVGIVGTAVALKKKED